MNRVGEIVEQFRVRRRLAAPAEIAGRADEAVAEMMQPDAVDHHAGGERVVLAGDGAGQLQPAAAFFERLATFR